MEMSDAFIEDHDIDWFSAYQDGCIAHFTSGGTLFVPRFIRMSMENYEKIYDYFINVRKNKKFEIIEENLPIFINSEKRNRYLLSFIDMASRGFFSYDVNSNDRSYKLISRPIDLNNVFNLPNNFKKIIYHLPEKIESGEKTIYSIE